MLPNKRTLACIALAAKFVALSLVGLGLVASKPEWVSHQLLRKAFPDGQFSVSSVRWLSHRSIEIEGLQIFGLASVDRARIAIRPFGIWRDGALQIESIELEKPKLVLQWDQTIEQQKAAARRSSPDSAAAQKQLWPLKIDLLKISGGSISIVDIGPGIPDIVIPINTEFQQLATLEDQVQKVSISSLSLTSPYDVLAKVVHIDTVDIEFSLEGLLHHRIEKLRLSAPVIYLGPDLFWFSERVQEELQKLAAPQMPTTPWVLGEFDVTGGQVVIASQGEEDFPLPVVFQVHQRGMAITRIEDLHMKSTVVFPPRNLHYDQLDLQMNHVRGQLYFALPRTETHANNIVNQLLMESARWRRLEASNLWMSATCDARGIYVDFGGDAYKGYINGAFSFFFQDLTWKGSIAASRVNLLPITEALTPDHVRLKALATGTILAEGTSSLVRTVNGSMRVAAGGKMEILTIDDLLAKIPSDLTNTKGDMIRIALQAFRDYHFKKGDIEFLYHPPRSTFKLKTEGPEGKRDIDVVYHHQPAATQEANP